MVSDDRMLTQLSHSLIGSMKICCIYINSQLNHWKYKPCIVTLMCIRGTDNKGSDNQETESHN